MAERSTWLILRVNTRRNLEGYLAAIPENLQTASGSDTTIG